MPNTSVHAQEREEARREFANMLRILADKLDAEPDAFEAAVTALRDNAQVVVDAFAAMPRHATVAQWLAAGGGK